MDPRAVARPVGPHPPRVYWIRRGLLLLLLVIVVVLLAHACGGSSGASGGKDRIATQPQPTPSTTPTSTPSATTTAAPHRISACRAGRLRVTASTDKTSYAAKSSPHLTAVVTNTGPTCRFDTAPATRVWRILSGNDEIWTTSDCKRDATPAPIRMKAGQSFTYGLVWSRHRSEKGCASPGPAAQPGTYRLYVAVHGVTSAAAVFRLSG